MSGRFRGDLWFDKKVHGRTMLALSQKKIYFPPECNPRKRPEYKAEYLRQGRLFHAERARKKIERRLAAQQAARAAKEAQYQNSDK